MALVALLHFEDGGTTITDAVPGNVWTASGGAVQSTVSPITGLSSLDLTSAEGGVSSTTPAVISNMAGTRDWRVDIRIKGTTAPPWFFTTLFGSNAWNLNIRNSNELDFEGANSGSRGGFASDGAPHLLTVSYVNSTQRVYGFIDGTLVMNVAYGASFAVPTVAWVGKSVGSSTGWRGKLDEFRYLINESVTASFVDDGLPFPGPGGTGYSLIVSPPAAFSVAAPSVALQVARVLSVTPAAYAGAAPSVSMAVNRALSVTPAAYAVAGSPVTLLATRSLSVTPAAYAVAAPSVALQLARLLSVSPAAYAVAAPAASLAVGRALSVTPIAYAVSAPAVALQLARILTATPVAYSVSPASVDLTISGTGGVTVDPAAYVVAPAPVSLLVARVLQVTPAGYAVAAPAASLLRSVALSVTPASYTRAAPAVGLLRALVLGSSPAAFSVVPAPVVLALARIWTVSPGAYSVSPADVALAIGSAFVFSYSERVLTLPAQNRYVLLPAQNRYVLLPPV